MLETQVPPRSQVSPMKARTTRAAILTKPHAPLEVAEVEMPPLGVGQVMVEMAASGICGKQIDEVTGRRGVDPHLPHLLGHEGAGVVIEVGPGVRKVKPGDHVVLHWMKGSGIDAATPAFRRQGAVVNAGWVTTFSEHTIVSENRLTPVPPNVKPDAVSLLGCAVTTGLGIISNDAALKPGQSIAVFGAGGVGLNVIQGAALVAAHPIIAIDLQDHRLEHARQFGATHTINAAREDVKAALRELTSGNGLDVTVDLTGDVGVRELAYVTTSNKGRTIFAGVPEVESKICIDSFPLHFGRRMIGVHGGDTQPDVDIPRYVRLYQLGKLKLDEQITHRFSLDQVNEALEQLRKGEGGKYVLMMPGALTSWA